MNEIHRSGNLKEVLKKNNKWMGTLTVIKTDHTNATAAKCIAKTSTKFKFGSTKYEHMYCFLITSVLPPDILLNFLSGRM